jgi:hypothetical protein
MKRSLRNRLRRIERDRGANINVRCVICPVAYGEPLPEDWETAPAMTEEEWEAKHCDAPCH